jgi:hypothetical protein
MRRRIVVLLSFIALWPALALAQATATGTVSGKIVDSSGGVVPGASVTLKSPEALGEFSATTDAQGLYRVPNLPPATYEVRAELQGFETVVRRVQVRTGATQTVDFTMAIGSLQETVTVTGEAPIVDPERAGLSVNVNSAALTALPMSTNRRYSDVWGMMPGVNVRPDQPDSNPAVNSRYNSENQIKVDGMEATDPYGQSVFTVSLAHDAVQDIQVRTIGADAEEVGHGGTMNVVTKSGGNSLHGTGAFFIVPQRFNGTNVTGVPANRREDYQPDFTLGGPIQRDRVWFFTAYKRAHENATVNNAPVPRQRRGNMFFVKTTAQPAAAHRVSFTFQYDPVTAKNALVRSSATGNLTSGTSGLGGAAPQTTAASAFGDLSQGGPFVGANYSWVINSNTLFQLVANYMINKPQNTDPSGDFGVTRIIQSNPTNNILGSLTTIAMEGSLGVVDRADRSLLFIAPSLSYNLNRWGSHDLKVGTQLYPIMRNKTSRDLTPVEYYFRPPGTTGAQDILFERQTFRNMSGSGSDVANLSWQNYFATYFQDRWRVNSRLTIKGGVRFEVNRIYTQDRNKVLSAILPVGFPTKTADLEFSQNPLAWNVGGAYDTGKWGVFRGTAGKYFEWLDLGGGDGTTHAPYVVATDVLRASPRTLAPMLNQTIEGPFPVGVNYGDGNKRTYAMEYSLAWEKSLPNAGSISATFVMKNSRDHQTGDDINMIRDPITGKFLGRVWPNYDTISRTYAPNRIFTDFTSLQIMYTRNFTSKWGINANYFYQVNSRIYNEFSATSENFQYMISPKTGQPFQPSDFTCNHVLPHHNARISTFVRMPFDFMISAVYAYTAGPKYDLYTGDYPLGTSAPRVVLSNGRSVTDPFFNIAYPVAGKRGVDTIQADGIHNMNLRIERTFRLPGTARLQVSADAFNVFNGAGAYSFLSAGSWLVDVRRSTYNVPAGYQPARVGQLGIRVVF